MTYSVDIAEAAEEDIREAFLWYESQKDGLGLLFEKHLSNAIESIKINPHKTQVRYGITRIFFLDKFPYGIHFQFENEQILIVAVFHTSRNPEKWKER